MYCEKCGKEMRYESRFCGMCGAEQTYTPFSANDVEFADEAQMNECPSCGKKLPPRAGFCVYCGKAITPPKGRPKCLLCKEPLVPGARYCISCGIGYAEAAEGILELEELPRCPSCGAEVDEPSAFCLACGSSLSGMEEARSMRLVPVCYRCGTPLNKSSDYCFSCGEAVSNKLPIIDGDTLICRVCGEQIQRGGLRKKCWGCGVEFSLQPWVCQKCGKENLHRTAHCAECGANRV